MRVCIALGCLVGLLLLAANPWTVYADESESIANTVTNGPVSSSRDLLVVDKKAKPAADKAVAKSDGSKKANNAPSNQSDGTSKVTVGQDLIVLDDRPQPKSDSTPTPKQPKQVTAARQKGRKQAGLGRRGGPGFRQPVPGTFPDDYILPGCRPGLGVICADNDNLGILKAQPAEVSLDAAYPFFEVAPTATAAGSTTATLDVPADTFTTETTAGGSAGVGVTAGTEQFNTNTEVTTTLAATEVDGSRVDRIIPDSVSATVDSTAAEGTYEWRTLHPVYTYVIGQNWGFPVGLATVSDGITGKKK